MPVCRATCTFSLSPNHRLQSCYGKEVFSRSHTRILRSAAPTASVCPDGENAAALSTDGGRTRSGVRTAGQDTAGGRSPGTRSPTLTYPTMPHSANWTVFWAWAVALEAHHHTARHAERESSQQCRQTMSVRYLVIVRRRGVLGKILRTLRVRSSAKSRLSWALNSLLMTSSQEPVCASQDKILRSVAEGLRELPQAAQDDYRCESLRPESGGARDGGDRDDAPSIS